ncbi:MAG: dTMP kinase [Deltaproteobacteria bacterium]|nr:dTMP kinase [Deltaproteobacteria bacterium]MBW2385338.1 dTMP kinase [Deltaproteobacteria bacterium]MBW2697060.1 dTMP kinase [Deltaproteobacteria bacterium]
MVGSVANGWLIAVEGIDGAGKTTQAELLAAALREAGYTAVLTKEPTKGPHGQKIRELSTAGADLSPEEELGYFIEDRREHVRELIEPALARGEVVITDRYYLSNVAYQGAHGLSPDVILTRNEALFPQPTAILLIEVSPEEGLRRVHARGGPLNKSFERIDFLTRAAEIFDAVERPYVRRIDGEAPPHIVHARVREALRGVFDL